MIQFKSDTEKKEFKLIKERLKIIAQDMAYFCHDNGVDFVITDVMSDANEDLLLGRVSTSHSEGRALDIRTRGWSDEFKQKFENHFSELYKDWAAISKSTMKERLLFFHGEGRFQHYHLQIKQYKGD